MAGARGAEHCASIMRVEHDVVDGTPEEVRTGKAPFAALRIAMQDERALARADEQGQ